MPLSPPAGARRAVAAAFALLALAVAALAAAPSARADGIFVAACKFAHRAADDPIVFHGMRGMSHSHDFIGNASTNARSTARSLRRAPTNCTPAGDHSAYWVPTLYRDGKPVKPAFSLVYYKDYFRFGRVQPFPLGLRMLAGNPFSKKPQPGVVRWTCEGDNNGQSPTIPDCGAKDITLRVNFPDCWDGRRLDSRDHRSHMAYNEEGGKELGPQRCPASHPIVVPQLQVNVDYPLHDGRGVSLASGSVFSAHADFFDAWKPSALQAQVDDVLNAGRACHPLAGCTRISAPNDEPLIGRPLANPLDRFYAPSKKLLRRMGHMGHTHDM